jgi:hypothetical protein
MTTTLPCAMPSSSNNLKNLSRCLLIGAALSLAIPSQAAVTANGTGTATTTKKTVKKGSSKKVAPAPIQLDDGTPDTQDAIHTEYSCEAGNKVSIYHKNDDVEHISLRWKQQLLRLTRVETSTGAHRFESLKHGLVWIGIPAKGILLDSSKGRQLANECKSAEQAQLSSQTSSN